MKHSVWNVSVLAGTAAVLLSAAVYRHYLPPIRRKKKAKYPYALLLGCACYPDGTPSESQLIRVMQAARFWKEGAYETLIISGGAVANKFVEAETMEKLVHLLDPELPVILETNARNTWENFENAKALIGDLPLLIITGSTHARRANAMASSFFTDYAVEPAPDFKWHRLRRELLSRLLYIRLELKKQFKGDFSHARTHSS